MTKWVTEMFAMNYEYDISEQTSFKFFTVTKPTFAVMISMMGRKQIKYARIKMLLLV